ncbi:disulfide bond formation protein DsbA [Nocardioides sp. Root79]|uniref:DsbA family oxidoreductase n=1 Tax=Nocardioides sp. Root79 TaxID=1736600 RepID=UPI000702E7A4|nr:DsbA family oxidoreductase [Nocardioides sp. Root79]KRC55146.1 disulfide bond formation protein DsbA [Nocardioides sp. Root79]KRC73970.1 disulfide bond formation protein DsbA [Nocardioides sp. Root240]
MRIEIWADVVCPWCYIGKRRLEKAIAGFEHGDDVEVVYRSYELDPFAPEVGTESTVTVLGRKFGADEAGTRAMMARADEVAAAEGLTFSHADALHARTLTAHRLLHLAKAEGLQHELMEQVLAAYFTRGESLGDHDVLRKAAAEAGLDAGRVEEVLASTEYRDDVMADVAQAQAYGSSGVPFFVIDGRFGISGAQPTELFEQALAQAWSSREG